MSLQLLGGKLMLGTGPSAIILEANSDGFNIKQGDKLLSLMSADDSTLPTATSTPTDAVVATATPTNTVVATATPTDTVVATATPTHTVVATTTPTDTVLSLVTFNIRDNTKEIDVRLNLGRLASIGNEQVSGIQLYLDNIMLQDTRATQIATSKRHPKVAQWFIATNTVDGVGIVYAESNGTKLSATDGTITLCTCSFTQRGTVNLHDGSMFESKVIDVTQDAVHEYSIL